jgi:hypothetical protein
MILALYTHQQRLRGHAFIVTKKENDWISASRYQNGKQTPRRHLLEQQSLPVEQLPKK